MNKTISKSGATRSSFRKRKTAKDDHAKDDDDAKDDDGERCCVCFESPDDDDSTSSSWSAFPCAHTTCDTCFARLSECPICRMSKAGQSATDRAAVEARAAVRETVVFFRGGSGGHPFGGIDTLVRVAGLPPSIVQSLRGVLADGMDFGRPLVGQPLSFGERQQRVARVMRAGEELRIQDLLGRRI